jgi:prepilin-type N-terminal cleavage/methylation domain-containing protein
MKQSHPLKNDHPSSEGGFTLIEVLIALSIFAVGILAVASSQVTVIQGNATARFSNEASVLAQAQLENLIALPLNPAGILPAELDSTNNGTRAVQDATGRYTVDWTVSDLHNPVDNAVEINLSVTWRERGTQRRVAYRFIKTASI